MTESSSHRPSILIVDDDEVYRNRLARAFVDRGYDVRTGQDFDSALAHAQVESPEFAVVDLKMPGKSGLELVKSLKDIDPSTKTIVLTGYGSIATAIDAVRLGAAYYLSKPADADDIVAAFARRGAAAAAPGHRVQGAFAGARRVGAHQPRAVGLRGEHLGGGAPPRDPPSVAAAQAAEVSAQQVTSRAGLGCLLPWVAP